MMIENEYRVMMTGTVMMVVMVKMMLIYEEIIVNNHDGYHSGEDEMITDVLCVVLIALQPSSGSGDVG